MEVEAGAPLVVPIRRRTHRPLAPFLTAPFELVEHTLALSVLAHYLDLQTNRDRFNSPTKAGVASVLFISFA